MGEVNSTKWIIVVLLYMFIINIIILGSQAVADYYGDTWETNLSVTNATFTNNYDSDSTKCESPRHLFYLSSEGVLKSGKELGILYSPIIEDNCEQTAGIYSQLECQRIEGCEWVNVTSGWWFWETTTDIQSCEGNINWTYYNNGVEPSTFLNVCNLPLIDNNTETSRSVCENIGCSIVSYDYSSVDYSATGIWNNLKDLATFNLDFNTETPFLATMISFFALYLPLIILLLQLRFLLPI